MLYSFVLLTYVHKHSDVLTHTTQSIPSPSPHGAVSSLLPFTSPLTHCPFPHPCTCFPLPSHSHSHPSLTPSPHPHPHPSPSPSPLPLPSPSPSPSLLTFLFTPPSPLTLTFTPPSPLTLTLPLPSPLPSDFTSVPQGPHPSGPIMGSPDMPNCCSGLHHSSGWDHAVRH